MEAIKGLLNEVYLKIRTLQVARERFSAQLAPDFNFFDYLRKDEMGVSRVIADLLDPKGAHGQGGVFLQAFAKMLKQEWIDSTDDWQVVTEQQANGKRRIDVYLESKNVGVIGIENKPWAADQKNQLIEYARHLEKQAGNKEWRLIYLGNNEPSDDSITKKDREELSGNLICLKFHVLEEWLNDCAAHSKALVVRVFIEELAKFVRTNINGELDMSEEKEVIGEIRKSDANITAAFQVSKVMTALKQGLLQSFHDKLKSELDENGFDLVWEEGMTNGGDFVGFGVKFGRQDKFNLHIQFTGKKLKDPCWGIRRIDESVKRDNVWQGINEVMQSLFGPGHDIAQVDVWWSWISKAPDSQFKKEYEDWEVSEKPWVEMNNGRLVEKIVNLSLLIHRKFQEENKLYLLSSNA